MLIKSCILILYLLSNYSSALYSSESGVKELHSYNYKESLDNATAPVMFVEFYAPWCGHCKSLVPIMENLARELSFHIPICSVNCEEQREICERFGIQKFPTLKIGYISQTSPTIKKSWIEYNEDRNIPFIKHSLYKYCPSTIKPLLVSDAPSVLSNTSHLKAYVFASSEEDLVPINFLAWQYQSSITIYNGLTSRQIIKNYFNLDKFPFLLVQTTNPSTNPGSFFIPEGKKPISASVYNSMSSFLNRYIISLPELNTSDDFAKYCLNANAPICLIALIHNPYSEQSLNRIRILEDISKASSNPTNSKSSPFSFMWINRDIHDDVMINYDPETYQEKTDPDVLIFNSKREKFGAWFGGDSWDKQNILTMLDEIKLGNTKLNGDPPQFHPFYEWISAGKYNEKQDL